MEYGVMTVAMAFHSDDVQVAAMEDATDGQPVTSANLLALCFGTISSQLELLSQKVT